ncbi:MAG: transglycosylase SLT domain-containing protein [Acidimicrobiales bacterium]
MSSPATTATLEGVPSLQRTARRSPRVVRVAVSLLAIVGLAFATSACSPEAIAKDAIRKNWSRLSPCAERIVKRESNFQADAVNPSSGTTGLFQIHPTHASWIKATFGYDFSEMKDPYKNAQVARELSNRAYRYWGDGWQPWRLSGRAIRNGGCPA